MVFIFGSWGGLFSSNSSSEPLEELDKELGVFLILVLFLFSTSDSEVMSEVISHFFSFRLALSRSSVNNNLQ